ncbi:hypothetical protein ACTFIU_001931 [Dictyostelium citrinum]
MFKLSNPFDYENDYKYSQNDPISFWDEVAKKYVHWDKMYDKVYSGDEMYPDWFNGGQLNTCFNLLDKHINTTKRDQVALIYECPFLKKTIKLTYNQLYEKVCEFSRVLVNLNISKNDNVIIYMANSIEAPIAMLSCTRIGATYCTLFDGYPIKSLIDRIETITPKLIITSNYGILNDEIITFTPTLKEAIELSTFKPNHIITHFRNNEGIEIGNIEIPNISNTLNWNEEIEKLKINNQSAYYEYVPVESSHPLSIFFTSGTTGNSKPVVRSNGGNLVGFVYNWDSINSRENEKVFFSHSSIGWVTFHLGLIGSLALGKTFVMLEGGIIKPIHYEDYLWATVEKHKINTFLTLAKTIRYLIKNDPHCEKVNSNYDISSLFSIWVSGEVVEESIPNYIETKMKCNSCCAYGQTEAGCFFFFDYKRIKNNHYNTLNNPTPFLKPSVFSEDGIELPLNQIGEIVFKLPLPPSFATTFYKNDQLYKKIFTTFPGYYNSGDLGFKYENDYYGIVSRADDQIKIGGFKVQLNTIETSILKHPLVLECCSIGIFHPDLKNVPFGLLVLKDNSSPSLSSPSSLTSLSSSLPLIDLNQLKNQINSIIKNDMDFYSQLTEIIIVPQLPKTKSGKIPRQIISRFLNEPNYQLNDNTCDQEVFYLIKELYIKNQIK